MEKKIIGVWQMPSLKKNLGGYIVKCIRTLGDGSDKSIRHIVRYGIFRDDPQKTAIVMGKLGKVKEIKGEYHVSDIVRAVIETNVMAMRKGGEVRMAHIE